MMKEKLVFGISVVLIVFVGCSKKSSPDKNAGLHSQDFPAELVNFTPYENNPVFTGTGQDTWDRTIRERGYILKEGDTYSMWYTGYNENRENTHYLGYATSPDGICWTRYAGNPIFKESWVEDMMVVKQDGVYFMFAEGRNDFAHWLTSSDKIHWTEQGNLDIRNMDGSPISPGAYGTPTVWIENGTWYLFYERGDLGVWLATSTDHKTWTNVQDDPVLKMGPEEYDQKGLALNQVIKYKRKYYGYYHATAYDPWRDWTTNVAVSDDLIHWKKYPHNPIVSGDKSSGIVVFDGKQFRLYTMHPDVRVYFPSKDK